QSSDQVTGGRTLLGISTPWEPSSWSVTLTKIDYVRPRRFAERKLLLGSKTSWMTRKYRLSFLPFPQLSTTSSSSKLCLAEKSKNLFAPAGSLRTPSLFSS